MKDKETEIPLKYLNDLFMSLKFDETFVIKDKIINKKTYYYISEYHHQYSQDYYIPMTDCMTYKEIEKFLLGYRYGLYNRFSQKTIKSYINALNNLNKII